MSKYKITIIVKTDADPGHILDAVLEFGEFLQERTSEPCILDEDSAMVSDEDDEEEEEE